MVLLLDVLLDYCSLISNLFIGKVRNILSLMLSQGDDEFRGNEGSKRYQKMLANVKRNSLEFGSWRIVDGLLYKHLELKYVVLAPASDSWKLVVPKTDCLQVLISVHDSPTAV